MHEADMQVVRQDWDNRLEQAHPGSCWYTQTDQESQRNGWALETYQGPFALKPEALAAAKRWNDAAFGEYCTGHQVTPYVEVVRVC